MPDVSTIAVLSVVVLLALTFDFINGFHDTAISIATVVSSHVMTPRQAILMAAALNFVGALISHNVAKTISSGLIHTTMIPEYVVIATLIAAIAWDLLTWYYGLPSSSSHALIGGLVGASIALSASLDIVQWGGVVKKVLIPLITSPLIGFVLGFILMKCLYMALARTSPYLVNRWFSELQIVSAAFVALTHGSNDAQKSMGVITLALVSYGAISDFHIPPWVILSCAAAMAAGTAMGGWRIIKTVGTDFVELQPVHGFCAETSASAVILTATAMGIPISTTHVITSAILGVGLSQGKKKVNWGVGIRIVWAWVLTIPASAAAGYFAFRVLSPFLVKL